MTDVSGEKKGLEEAHLLLRDSDGSLRDKITEAHVFVLSRSAYRSMCDLLYERFGTGASVILFDMGEGYGKKLASGLARRGMNQERTLETVAELSYLAGWGKAAFRIIEDEKSQRSIECIVRNSMFTLTRKGIGESTCFFLSGLCAGVVTELFNQFYKCIETQCIGSGGNVCKFMIVPAKT